MTDLPAYVETFRRAATDILGFHFPGTDREMGIAALAVALARAPRGSAADVKLMALVSDLARGSVPHDVVSSEKRGAFEHLLAGGSVMVHIDARRPGVSVPPAFEQAHDLCLRLGYGLTPPIDLKIDEHGIEAVLSFASVPHRVMIPWAAVWGIRQEGSTEMQGWAASVPQEVFEQQAAAQGQGQQAQSPPIATAPPKPTTKPGGRPKLSLVPLEAEPNEAQALLHALGVRPPEPKADPYQHLAPADHDFDRVAQQSQIVRLASTIKTDATPIWNQFTGMWAETDEQLRARIKRELGQSPVDPRTINGPRCPATGARVVDGRPTCGDGCDHKPVPGRVVTRWQCITCKRYLARQRDQRGHDPQVCVECRALSMFPEQPGIPLAIEPPKEACGRKAETPGWAPCTRPIHADGPCAHYPDPPFDLSDVDPPEPKGAA